MTRPSVDGRRPAPWVEVLVVAVLGMCLFLPGLGNHDLWNPDEPRYAQVASEMLASGDFLVPHLNGELYNQKPPLHFWSIAAFGALLGPGASGGLNEVAARLPSALAGIGILMLLFAIGRRLFDRPTAWLAVLIFGSSARILWQGRTGQIDMQLVFWVTLAMYFFVRGHGFEAKRVTDPRWYPWFFVACGFGGLAKGPVGLLPPLLSIVAYLWLTGQRDEVRRLRIGRGLLIWIGIMCLWLLPAALSAGFDYLRYLVVDQNLGRYAQPTGHHRPFYYFLTVLPGDFFPWFFFLPTALILGWRHLGRRGLSQRSGARASDSTLATWWRQTDWRGFWLCLCWMVVTLIFFSLSPGKRTVYILTMYPGMALLVALVLQRLTVAWRTDPEKALPHRAWMVVPLAVLGVLLATAAILAPAQLGKRPEMEILAPWTLPLVIGLLAMLALVAVAGCLLVWRGRATWAPRLLAVGLMTVVVTLVLAVLPQIDPFKSPRRLVERLEAERLPHEPFAVFPRKDEAVIFYAGPPVLDIHREELADFLASAPRVWLLAERDDWSKVEPSPNLVEVDRDADRRDGYLLLTSPPWPRRHPATAEEATR